MKMYRFLVVIEKINNNYSAYSPDLPGCVSTGATREEAEMNMYEAIVPKKTVLKITPTNASLIETSEKRLKVSSFRLNMPVKIIMIKAKIRRKSGIAPIRSISTRFTHITDITASLEKMVGPRISPKINKKKASGILCFFNTLAMKTPIPSMNAKYVTLNPTSTIVN